MKKLLFGMLAVLMVMAAVAAFAITKNPATGAPGYTPVVMPINGSFTTTTTNIVSWRAPTGFQIMNVSASVRASSGTNPTLKIRGSNAGFTNYSGTIAPGAVTDLSTAASPSRLTDEGVQSVDLVIGGSSPSFSDITLFLYLKQL